MDRKVIDYTVISIELGTGPNAGDLDSKIEELLDHVNVTIKECWEPFGSLALSRDSITQAMVKYAE